MADEAGALREVSMSLAEQDRTLENLVFEIALSDEANTALSLTLTPRHGAAEDAEIPEAVLSAMQSGENTANITLTDDVFRLLRAWQATFGGDAVSADLRLKADCGPVVLDTTLGLGRQRIDGMTVTGIQKGPVTLYVSDGKILDSSGNAVDLGTNSWAKSANLLDAAPLFGHGQPHRKARRAGGLHHRTGRGRHGRRCERDRAGHRISGH